MSNLYITLALIFSSSLLPCRSHGAPIPGARTDIAVFEHENFRGGRVSYSLGSTCTNLMGYFRDKVSSVRVSSGCVQLCRQEHCAQCTDIWEDHADLSSIELNDEVQSIKRCEDYIVEYEFMLFQAFDAAMRLVLHFWATMPSFDGDHEYVH